MIFLVSPAGIPISWTVNGVLSGYGTALETARNWHAKNGETQMVIEVDRGVVKRSELFWNAEKHARQNFDRPIIMQGYRNLGLDESTESLVAEHIRAKMIEIAHFIPEDEWEVKYPGSALMRRRWQEWFAAEEEADKAGRRVEWDPRWAPMMRPPEDWKPTYKVSEDGLRVEPCDPKELDPTRGYVWPDESTAENAMRTMNSGWSFDETLVMMQPEPVEEAPTSTIGGP